MRNSKRNYWFVLFLSLVLFLLPTNTEAIKGDAMAIKPVYPENQEGGETGYFNLKVTPDQEQEIEIEVRNDSTEDLTVTIKALQAATSDGGVITYNEEKEVDNSTNYPFKDIAKLEKEEVIVPASSSEKIKVYLKLPSEAFSGKLIGGLTISEKRDLTKDEEKQAVVNEFQYAIPIVLFENDDKVEPEIELVNIEPGLRNYRPYIEATLKNSAYINISKMTIDSTITNRSTQKTLITRKELNYQMAPTSAFNFGFDLQNSKVIPGDYLAEFKIVADGKEFELKKAFTITKAKAEEINSQNLYSDEDNSFPIWLIVLIIIFLLILGGIFFYFIKNKSRKSRKYKRAKKKNKSKKKNANKK